MNDNRLADYLDHMRSDGALPELLKQLLVARQADDNKPDPPSSTTPS